MSKHSHHQPPPTHGVPSLPDFARQVQQGIASARDRFNNPLAKGHLVLYESQFALVAEVVDIIPVMDPRQIGMVRVVLAIPINLPVPVNRPNPMFTIVGVAADSLRKDIHDKAMAAGPGPADSNHDGGQEDGHGANVGAGQPAEAASAGSDPVAPDAAGTPPADAVATNPPGPRLVLTDADRGDRSDDPE
jgi:hypothetical protein